jgi:tagaturonate reductase
VRILNGGHTLIAPLGLLLGCESVLEAVRHRLVGPYLRRLLFDEVVPSLTAPNGEAFARDVLIRFANPSLRHALRDITLQQTAKLRVRVVPSILRFIQRTGHAPTALAFGFAAYLLSLRGTVRLAADADGERVRGLWRVATDDSDVTLRSLVMRVCGDEVLWHANLTGLAGFAEHVADDLVHMVRRGVGSALAAHLGNGDEALDAATSSLSTS